MRVVADTNTIVSGLLWHGPPRRILDAARAGSPELFTSLELLTELEDVGDSHLLGLTEYEGIPILRAARLVIQLQP